MKVVLVALLSLVFTNLYSQNRILLQQTFFKESFIRLSRNKSIETFFPANTNQLNLSVLNIDSTQVYTDLELYLFKRFAVEVKKKDITLSITPILNSAKGRVGKLDSNYYPVYRNTRGVYVEGDLLNKVGFNFSFCENQASFQDYENAYFNEQGEKYIKYYGKYSVQNAVIPGASRTKEFKVTGYDYAYSSGNIHFNLHKNFQVELGNGQNFIGSGYRSLLLSDNSSVAPGIRLKWKINRFFDYQVLYRKQLNLYRKLYTLAVESNYETKIFAASYLTFKPTESIALSLFTGGNQLRGDSLRMHTLDGRQLIPVPLMQNDIFTKNSSTINGITGLNLDVALKDIRLYGQIVADKYGNSVLIAKQLGFHYFNVLGIKDLHVQTEWNEVPKNFYSGMTAKLSYSHFNLPSAHPKGNNFKELFVKIDYKYKYWYLSSRSNFYFTDGGTLQQQFANNSIFNPTTSSNPAVNGTTILESVELGFRFNRLYNGTIFLNYIGRASAYDTTNLTSQSLWIGLRTAITNEYFDF